MSPGGEQHGPGGGAGEDRAGVQPVRLEPPTDPEFPGAGFEGSLYGPQRRRLRRRKVVLAERPGAQRIPRVIGEREEIPGGEGLVRWLIGKQLRAAIPLAFGTMLVIGVLPALFALVPEISRFRLFGISLPWLVLGALMYPFLVGVGILHNRMAERNEQDFIDSLDE